MQVQAAVGTDTLFASFCMYVLAQFSSDTAPNIPKAKSSNDIQRPYDTGIYQASTKASTKLSYFLC